MNVCYCILGGTAACVNCPNRPIYYEYDFEPNYTLDNFKTIKTPTITEIYENGQLVKRIIEN